MEVIDLYLRDDFKRLDKLEEYMRTYRLRELTVREYLAAEDNKKDNFVWSPLHFQVGSSWLSGSLATCGGKFYRCHRVRIDEWRCSAEEILYEVELDDVVMLHEGTIDVMVVQ